MPVDQWEVMFWNKYNEAHLFGNASVLEFETEEEANNFAEHAQVKDCASVTFMYCVGNTVTEEYERKVEE